MTVTPAEIAKGIAAIVAAIAIAVSQGLINGTAAKWAAIIIGVASAVGVVTVPNNPPAGTKLVKLDGPGEPIKSGRPIKSSKPPPVAAVPAKPSAPPPAPPTVSPPPPGSAGPLGGGPLI